MQTPVFSFKGRYTSTLAPVSLILCSLLAACSSVENASQSAAGWITPYKVDIVQGNFVSQEQLNLLRAGMTRTQVRDLLGTPLVQSLFHDQRWDYVFTLKHNGVVTQKRHLTLFFDGDTLAHFDSEPMPTEAQFVAMVDDSKVKKVPVLQVPDAITVDNTAASHQATPQEATASTPIAPPVATLTAATTTAAATTADTSTQASPNVSTPTADAALVATPAPIATAAVVAQPVSHPRSNPVRNVFDNVSPKELGEFLSAWQQDAQSGHLAEWLDHYISDFRGASATHAQWEAAMRERWETFTPAIEKDSIHARKLSDTSAHISFREVDRAKDQSGKQEVELKTLLLVQQDNRWLIQREFSVPLK